MATKVGVTEDGGRDLSPAHVVASCEESLRHLDTDHIDLFQVHFDDPKTPGDCLGLGPAGRGLGSDRTVQPRSS
ncbi:MAG: aldo/keto reductase [Bacillota bacterium]